MANLVIIIARDFSRSPGARYSSEGDFSGEEFRREWLVPKLREALESGVKLTVNLDGSSGYSTAFLEESFGGLVRTEKFTKEQLDSLEFISDEVPSYINNIKAYINHALANS